jgi:hypothetical protein
VPVAADVPMIYEMDADLLDAVTTAIDKEIQKQCMSGGDLDLQFVAAAAILAVINYQRRH